jgi:hypothetical protein
MLGKAGGTVTARRTLEGTISWISSNAGHSHVRHFKLQAWKFLACPSSCSTWPPLGMAGGTIMKRRLIML